MRVEERNSRAGPPSRGPRQVEGMGYWDLEFWNSGMPGPAPEKGDPPAVGSCKLGMSQQCALSGKKAKSNQTCHTEAWPAGPGER